MGMQDRDNRLTDPPPTLDPRDAPQTGPAGRSADVAPIRETVRSWALEVLVAAYGGDTHRLLTDVSRRIDASVAYVDRPTVEAHLERPLSDGEWTTVAGQFTPMAFDEHVGDAGTLRTDSIDNTLQRAGVPGRALGGTPGLGPTRQLGRR
jgi:hypothetical protein